MRNIKSSTYPDRHVGSRVVIDVIGLPGVLNEGVPDDALGLIVLGLHRPYQATCVAVCVALLWCCC